MWWTPRRGRSLRDALARSSDRVVDIFKKWDEDKSGNVDKREFCRAVNALGFEVSDEEGGIVFDILDDDRSGQLEYKELNEMLRKGTGADAARARLKRGTVNDHTRGKNNRFSINYNKNFVGNRVSPVSARAIRPRIVRGCLRNPVELVHVKQAALVVIGVT